MKRWRVLGFVLAAGVALAQEKFPKQLEPVPNPPLPLEERLPFEPEVTIRKEPGKLIEEYRVPKGKVFMIKVTPEHGRSYYLVDARGDGSFVRQETLSEIKVPMWVLLRF